VTLGRRTRAPIEPRPRIRWPDGKDFAFAIFDDTDFATVEKLAVVYDFLADLGFRSTKSVWPIKGEGTPQFGGSTCEDPVYRDWTLELQARGFEIAYHGASYVTSTRDQTIRGLDRFREIYGHDPLTMANHSGCAESIYWGADRLTGGYRLLYNLVTRFRNAGVFRGHREGDPLFWGDLCRARVKYVRNFTYADTDSLAACPTMPYHDPLRPYVNAWFASSEGADVSAFNRRISAANQDRLERAGGACVMYTHLAQGFYEDGRLDREFQRLMERLSRKNGWFVPVATLLDYLQSPDGPATLSDAERSRLERRWLLSKFRVGPS
jgi:hypothetical protein